MGYQLGIDLGTTYTAAAVCRSDDRRWVDPEVVTLGTRNATVPSVMFLAPDGSVVVGEAAEHPCDGLEHPRPDAREQGRDPDQEPEDPPQRTTELDEGGLGRLAGTGHVGLGHLTGTGDVGLGHLTRTVGGLLGHLADLSCRLLGDLARPCDRLGGRVGGPTRTGEQGHGGLLRRGCRQPTGGP